MLKLTDFAGRWRFRRRLEGLGDVPGNLFDGVAVFSPVAGGLFYTESGEVQLHGRETRLLWREEAQGASLCFADGSDFHPLDLHGRVANAWHEGAGASHEMAYNFTHWPEWRLIWRLRNAGADTTMITDYRR